MRSLPLVICCLLLGSLANAQQKHLIESVKANSDVALEMNPYSAFWRAARAIHAKVDPNGDQVPGYLTEVRSRWTRGSIYFLFVCPYQRLSLKPSPDTSHETYELWNWNVAEVFIGSNFQDIK